MSWESPLWSWEKQIRTLEKEAFSERSFDRTLDLLCKKNEKQSYMQNETQRRCLYRSRLRDLRIDSPWIFFCSTLLHHLFDPLLDYDCVLGLSFFLDVLPVFLSLLSMFWLLEQNVPTPVEDVVSLLSKERTGKSESSR